MTLAGSGGYRTAIGVGLFLVTILLPAQIVAGPVRLSLLVIMMLVTFGPLVLGLLSGRSGPLLAPDLLILLHVVWAALALAANSPSRAITAAGSNALELMGPYLLARVLIRRREDFVLFIAASAVAVTCTLPFALYEALTHRDILLRLLDAIPGVAMPPEAPPDLRLGLDRVQAGFGHAILYGVFCSLPVTLTLVGLRDVLPAALRVALAGLVMLACFLSLSSGAILAVLLQFALLLWNWLFRSLAWRWWALAGVVVLAYSVVAQVADRSPLRVALSYATFNAQNAHYRALILEWGLRNVAANPLLGLGLEDWVRPDFMVSPTVDNFWLLTAMRYGLPGLVTLAAAFVAGLWLLARRDLGDEPALARLRLSWLVTMAGLGFSLFTVHVWDEAASFVFFLFGAGMWMAGDGRPPANRPATAPYTRFPPRPLPRR